MKKFIGLSLAAICLLTVSLTATGQEEEKKSNFKFGGLIRYNFGFNQYESAAKAPSRFATIDTWGVKAKGNMSGIDLDFEYRFYPTCGTHFVHHGYFGYGFSDNTYMRLGVFQKPFGIGKYASHSFWFQGAYYVGLEDDYDIGVGLDYDINDKAKVEIAYFRQAEPEGPMPGGDVTFGNAGAGRYSYDVTSGRVYEQDGNTYYESIRELNTGNIRFTYDIIDGVELGVSAQAGGIYNDYLNKTDLATAYAGHIYLNKNNVSLKLEYLYYNYQATGGMVDSLGNLTTYKLDNLQMGAYGANYMVASEAGMYVAGLAYTIPVNRGPLKSIQPYVDITYMDKVNPMFGDMVQLVPGMAIEAGPIYSYIEFNFGKNHSWLTEDFGVGLEQGRTYTNDPAKKDMYYYTDNAEMEGKAVPVSEIPWNVKFNINVGYYF